jgi:hypothetical protein
LCTESICSSFGEKWSEHEEHNTSHAQTQCSAAAAG